MALSDIASGAGSVGASGETKIFSHIGGLLDFYARRTPAAPALLAPGRPALTYGALGERTQDLVRTLRGLGIAPADRIAVALPRGADSALALIAVASSCACVPVNPDLTADELQRYFSELKLTALVTRADMNSASRDVARALDIAVIDFVPGPQDDLGGCAFVGPAVGPASASGASRGDNDAFILLTSGTAARPKMVPLTHRNVCLSATNAGRVLSLTSHDRLLNVLPLFHAHGLISGLLTALAAGSSVICTDGFDAASFFGWMRELQPTWYTAVPTIHRALLTAAEADPGRARASSLRVIRSASASLAPAILGGLEATFGVPVLETYGMTEAASQIAANPFELRKLGSVGRAAGPEIAIMDETGRALASGAHGEIVLRGANMSRGYYNDEAATQAAFRDSWFRTGDLGYLDADGYLFIVGRIKDVINRGGQKISPLEVEEVLLSHPAVLEAGVFAVPHPKLGENVAAVVVLLANSEATSDQLRKFARKRLAAYKVPSLIRSVAALPKGASGKVKRNALADLIATAEDADAARLPRTTLETQLAEIWAGLLELPQVGIDQDVFALGADSLAVTQMRSRLRERFNVDFSFEDIFDCATVAALATRLETAATHREAALPAWRRAGAATADAPLSYQQQRMYLLSRLDPTRYNYNVVEVALLKGLVDVAALSASLTAICARHEALRSVFVERQGEPAQLVLQSPPKFERIKLKPCPADNQVAVVRRETLKLAQYPFDLAHEPPLKVTLLSFDKSSHALVVNLHHLVTDGWSQRLFWEELAAHYAAARKKGVAARPSPTFQYRDFALWQQSWARTPAAKEQLDYWRTQLDGVTTLPLRTDRPRPEIWSGHGARHYFEFSRALSGDVRALSQDQGVTPFMILLAVFQCLLFRHTSHEDVATGSLIANRNQIESERLIGLFANTLILRNDFGGDPSFGEMLRRVRQVTLDAYRNQDLPIEEVLRALQIARRSDGNPLFRIMFILQNASIEAARFPGLSTRRLEVDPKVARFDITLELVEADGRFTGFFEYATDLFDAATIEDMAAQFKTLLKAVIANPEQRISRLPLLTEAERRQLLAKGHGVPANFTTRGNLSERFDRQARTTPNAVAVSDGHTSLSYRELARRSQAAARWLAREGVGAESVVALLAERGPDLLAAMIAVQRVGAAFLNLDPDQPPARLATILGSSCARVLLIGRAQSAMVEALLEPLVERIQVAELDDAIAPRATKPARAARRAASSLAYLIYTSGSSGAPKGVMIEQRGLSNHLASLISELKLSARDVIAQTAPQSFVISVWQFLAAPMVGARVHVCGNAIVQDPILLAREIEREGITVLEIVPSLLRVIVDRMDEAPILRAFARLRLLISTGEPLPVDLCRAWFARCPKVPLINAYGASECSDDVSLHRLTKPPATATSNVPVGAPLPNTQLYVLDANLEPQPVGVTGELCIGGAGVGRGYINDPAQNKQRFLPDSFLRQAASRLYRTGDLARRRADGTIECLGRADHQVKVRGYRIELKEIENALADHPSVRAGIVEPRREASGDVRLIAHIVARPGSRVSASELRDFLKSRLPGHAIPSAFLFMDQVPLNAHGKIDRSMLLAPAQQEASEPDAAVPARRFTEKVLSDIWIDLLKVENLSVTDNFFDLGGHSLLAGQAMARVARALGVSLPIKTIFEAPTIEELARRVDEAVAAKPHKPAASLPRLTETRLAENGPPTLSIAQDQMIRIEQSLPGLPLFNLPFAFRLQGPLDPATLAQAFGDIVRRHESLRTAFGWSGGEPVSRIATPSELGPVLTVEVIGDGRPHNNKRRQALELRKIDLLIEQETYTPFDTARPPLLRARLLQLHADDHVLLLTLHHAVADGWSIGVLFEELSSRYAALAGRPSAPLPKLPPAFSDVARWQRWWCGTDAARRQAADWTENLRGAAPIFDGDANPGASTGHHQLRLEPDLIARLTAFAGQHNATLFMCLLTGLKALLLARTGRTDISVATAMANRAQPDTDRIVGPFENTVIVRTKITPDLSFAQALVRVRQSVLDAHARQELPFNMLADHLEQQGIDPAALLQVYFTLQNPLRQPLDLPEIAVQSIGNIAREGQPVLPIDQTWLSLMLKERPTGITGSCNYKGELLEARMVGEWMEDFVALLGAAAAQPNTPLDRLLDRRAA
ncbi:non-ribosomal peptide synthetase [Bradyrhizobium diazoefficiens]|uniref:Putative peptide synthetase n=1 Tax=Bradyrhizobium diazoefficiens SEMIA 5080 TaxID=754504 RepID=A0A837CDM0_9BRAD|nr:MULTISPECIES: non-ribosomal peptide synthetase [Bradyrhizobium]APO50849.1 non-ribosomal peptide synthetase [Bradyrhizobium diazoefficiens]KGJ67329.1 putative peptide synthetase [Bradyrhizobium diazoefficiens SEMIA 5080]KOY12511.1 thioester reductase [Bradyrhizobium diazoefficiens]MCD9296875.1 non-ribosomal peptide synthetase [Bradyrhizobium diazoefficiens]MCD9814454.1 non-ribosomal peptide synthetase [Bradyrhizobium diazoefficiens]